MAAKAWRGCLEPDDAAFFSLPYNDQAEVRWCGEINFGGIRGHLVPRMQAIKNLTQSDD